MTDEDKRRLQDRDFHGGVMGRGGMTSLDPDRASPPRPPEKPQPYECCNRGCCPCIFDYYWDALERWETAVRKLGFDPAQVLEGAGRS